jgi:hypothetical protein
MASETETVVAVRIKINFPATDEIRLAVYLYRLVALFAQRTTDRSIAGSPLYANRSQ